MGVDGTAREDGQKNRSSCEDGSAENVNEGSETLAGEEPPV